MSSLSPNNLAMRRILERLAAGPASPLGHAQDDVNNGPCEDVSDASGAADRGSNSSSPLASEASDQDDLHHEPSGQHFNRNIAFGMATKATTYKIDDESDVPEGDKEEDDIGLHSVHLPDFLYPDNVTEIWASDPDEPYYLGKRQVEKGLIAPPTFHIRRRRPRMATEAQGSAVTDAMLPFIEKRSYDVEKIGNIPDDQPRTAKHKKSFTSTAVLLIGLSIALTFAFMDVDLSLMAAIIVPVLAAAALAAIAML